MERIIIKKLLAWKNNKINRKPLILRGARQVGKSYSVINFGKNYFKGKTHIINLERNPEFHNIFKKNFDLKRIISEIEIILNEKINLKTDLLFIDEIQECPKAIISLRYFYEQVPELHVIVAGSLLEFALKDISFPVGRVQILTMHPMNFQEFLLATNKKLIGDIIKNDSKKLSDNAHAILIDELRKYFFIGGMPECVKTYKLTGKINDVFEIQSNLLETFRQDFSKYSGHSDKRCLNAVFNSVSQKVGQQIIYTQLAEGFSNPTINKAFHLLESARLFKKIRSTSPAGLPLGANASEKKFKALFLDIGLLSRLSGISVSHEFQKKQLLSMFKGALAEQFVGQELITAGHENLYYWNKKSRNSTAETDFLIETNNEVIPIEVKSGSTGRLRSLHLLLKNFSNINKAYIFSEALYGSIPEQKLHFIPLYFVFSETKKK